MVVWELTVKSLVIPFSLVPTSGNGPRSGTPVAGWILLIPHQFNFTRGCDRIRVSFEISLQAGVYGQRLSIIKRTDLKFFTYRDSLASNLRAGELSLIFSILTGFFFIQPRMTSWMSLWGAVVFSDPGHACEREILCPACRSAELWGNLIINPRLLGSEFDSREII